MRKIITLFLLLSAFISFSQVKGNITAKNGETIPFVSIFIENTYTGTTSNEQGSYELGIKNTGNYTIVFQSLGYKTKKQTIEVKTLPHILNVVLEDETFVLDEIIISNTENPANSIIKKAIAKRKENGSKTGKFEADFYSKGIVRLDTIPEKIMGIKVEVLTPNTRHDVDSIKTGIFYLSETVSKIIFEEPNNLKERIIASKISGNPQGFSYNTALGTNYNFYENYIKFGEVNLVSPIAGNAFNYYRYKLEGSFFDENNNQINKIRVIPKRDKEPVFEGYIYILENSWAIYGIDLNIKGYRAQEPMLENLNLQQNFSYNANTKVWAKNTQTFDFKVAAFGVRLSGKFSHIFTNYIFHDRFEKNTFTKEIVFIEEDSNKKDSLYWNAARPIPLTVEETKDYVKKDSLRIIRTSQVYLDSIDKKENKFKVTDLLTGYSYKNSYKKMYFDYQGLKLLSFNTVQGWNFNTGISFTKREEEKGKYTILSADFNYGFSEDRLRLTGIFTHRFNNLNYATLSISGGSKAAQFNESEPITPLINTVSTLFFKDNFMKLYDKTFAKVNYRQEVFTGLYLNGDIEYSRRKALFNNTDHVLIKNRKDYTSNNPLAPEDYTTPAFDKHELIKAGITGSIIFGQKYITRPDGKINVRDKNYPALFFTYQKAFAGSEKNYEYDFIAARTTYTTTIGNKGDLGINIKAGKFFNADNISFIDYKHFNGNQTHVNDGNSYLNVFNLLPYYSHSTNNSYFEGHIEHNFKGYIMNKIPLLNQLQWNLIIGYHTIAAPEFKPYHEFTAGFDNIGYGKFRFLRIDYIRSYQSGFKTDGVIIGLKFLDLIK